MKHLSRFFCLSLALLSSMSVCLFPCAARDISMTAADLTALARHVGGVETITDPSTVTLYDCDGVSGLSAADLTRLARYVAGISDELYADTRLTVSPGDPDDNDSMTVPFPDLL